MAEVHSSESLDSTLSVASNASSTDKSHITSKIEASGNKSPEKCSICLSAPENRCFTDTCVHEFCFVCLLEWSKVKAECPLCKQKFRNIIHNIRSQKDYDEYEVKSPAANNNGDFGVDGLGRRFRYNTTMTFERLELLRHIRQMQLQLDQMRHNQRIANQIHREREHLQRLRYLYAHTAQNQERLLASAEFRRLIYDRRLRVRPSTDNRVRDTAPEFYVGNPAVTFRLAPWLERELGVLLDNNRDRVRTTVTYVLSLISRFAINSPEFQQRLVSILSQNTDHFCHEFYHFARSPLNMDQYDRQAHYQRVPVDAAAAGNAPNIEESAELITLNSPPNTPGLNDEDRDNDYFRRQRLELVVEDAEQRMHFAEADATRHPTSGFFERNLEDLRRAVEGARSRLLDLRAANHHRSHLHNVMSTYLLTATASAPILHFQPFHRNLFANDASTASSSLSASTAMPTLQSFAEVAGRQKIAKRQRATSPTVDVWRRKRIRQVSTEGDSTADDQPGGSASYPRNPSSVYSTTQYSPSSPVYLDSSDSDDSFIEVVSDSNSRRHVTTPSPIFRISSSPSSISIASSPYSPLSSSVHSFFEPNVDAGHTTPRIPLSSPDYGTTTDAVMPIDSSPARAESGRSWNSSISVDSRFAWSPQNGEDNDIEIVAELKPKAQRTPVLVDLLNETSDGETKQPGVSGYAVNRAIKIENNRNVFDDCLHDVSSSTTATSTKSSDYGRHRPQHSDIASSDADDIDESEDRRLQQQRRRQSDVETSGSETTTKSGRLKSVVVVPKQRTTRYESSSADGGKKRRHKRKKSKKEKYFVSE